MNKPHRRYSIFKVLGVLLTCVIVLPMSLKASTAEEINIKQYENCVVSDVVDSVDLLPDKVGHSLTCMEKPFLDDIISIRFIFSPTGQIHIILSTGQQYLTNEVDVELYVDNHKVSKGKWPTNGSGSAIKTYKSLSLMDAVLGLIAMGNSMEIWVGKKGGVIPLNGSAGAISDYISRIARYKK